ncbi:MAG: transcriptional repressor [FCB group bacterium]|nr:transcriptional repressor [FCB group bacterium]
MRFSSQREAILSYIRGVQSHPTALDIHASVKKSFPSLSLGTVYRNLNQLLEHHLITAIKQDEVVHYDGNISDHQHFRCKNCDSIIDLEFPVRDIVLEHGPRFGHEIHAYELYMTGICKNCKNETK